jgi:hypothetical protein
MNAPVIINVSLDDKVGPGAIEQRLRTVRAALRLCFQAVVVEIASATYTDPDGQAVHEPCCVAQIETDASPEIFEHAIYGIASSLGQDCIAVMYPDGTGKCVGPRAERWPFNPKFFMLPAAAQLRAEAA